MNDKTPQGLLSRVFFALACITLLIAPTQWSIEIRKNFFLSPADITLALTFGVWILDVIVKRTWGSLFKRVPPWSHILFVGFAAISMLIAIDKISAFRELVQYGLYFIVGYAVYDRLMHCYPKAMQTLFIILAATCLGITALTLIQYVDADTEDLMVRGTFGNRNVLSGYYTLALPLLFACLIETRSWLAKAVLALLFLAGLSLILSGPAYIAIVIAVILIAARKGLKWFIPVIVILLIWQSQVLKRLPRENDLVHFRSMALYGDDGTVERRYPDWQAASAMILTNPILGVGPGNYQKHIGQYYDNIPRKTGPSEPDIQNLYLVIAASMGIPALLAFLAMFMAPFNKENIFPMKHCTLIHGAIGSLCAFAFTAGWHPLLVRGIGLPFVVLLAFTRYLVQTESLDGNCSK